MLEQFKNFNYQKYMSKNPFYERLGERKPKKIQKIVYEPFFSVDRKNHEPFPTEYDDLARLHYLIRKRKSLTVLEFGVGKSTVVFADALLRNKKEYEQKIKNLRCSNPWECYSIDNNKEWISKCKRLMPKEFFDSKISHLHLSNLHTNTFQDRICTYFDSIPNISPDFIYLDGPDQFSPKGNIRGISTKHPDRMPMSGDILTFEHFLQPGTLIVVDGRTANARFLKCNFQRNWKYDYSKKFDQHFFELLEEPLGIYNEKRIKFCLGNSYFVRLKKFKK